ncbi:conserved hypothetical protein [Mycolicibacter sinensis]|uniref:Uncharacterized protein n=1 Tax=Mycolicibacter sinensis (strain JDM601) TaxID=875328 RepID=F5YRY6_MYCSD|nr:hypothetical protein [Mycolicibacter sinensis]AEF34768.1 conserved hypothetical protein [Mycolicibacter sinensis]
MDITIPEGRPNKRFMRYVRPPVNEKSTPLFPLRPHTRPLRLGIDVETIPEPPDGYLADFLTREEIEVHLLMPQGREHPLEAWARLLGNPVLHTVNFTTVAEAGRFADAAEFHITIRSEREEGWSNARFFPMLQQLDDQTATADSPILSIDERHTAAAYAAGAGAVELDAIVTNRATANRTDVGDNDIVIAVPPDDAVALIGHYLRVTSNPIVAISRGQLLGGGTWETTESTGTIVNSYLWGVASAMPYFDFAASLAGGAQGGPKAAEAFQSILIRLGRAARALDHLLAALSNPLDKRHEDVVEAAAEAFDRELLYLAAAFDIYGRLYVWLLDPSQELKKIRNQSLDSRDFIKKQVKTQYDESLLADVVRLQKYAWVCKQLRNHVHDGILDVVPQPGRRYGNATTVALMLSSISDFAPEAGNLDRDHYDGLGVWLADALTPFSSKTMVADLATAGFTLMGAALGYVEAFTKLIIRNKPAVAIAAEKAAEQAGADQDGDAESPHTSPLPRPSRFLGCVQAQPGETEPPLPKKAQFHKAIFGWHPETMA